MGLDLQVCSPQGGQRHYIQQLPPCPIQPRTRGEISKGKFRQKARNGLGIFRRQILVSFSNFLTVQWCLQRQSCFKAVGIFHMPWAGSGSAIPAAVKASFIAAMALSVLGNPMNGAH